MRFLFAAALFLAPVAADAAAVRITASGVISDAAGESSPSAGEFLPGGMWEMPEGAVLTYTAVYSDFIAYVDGSEHHSWIISAASLSASLDGVTLWTLDGLAENETLFDPQSFTGAFADALGVAEGTYAFAIGGAWAGTSGPTVVLALAGPLSWLDAGASLLDFGDALGGLLGVDYVVALEGGGIEVIQGYAQLSSLRVQEIPLPLPALLLTGALGLLAAPRRVRR